MAEIKTRRTDAHPMDFINTVENEQKKQDAIKLLEIFERVTGEKPAMWGTSIIGYGMYHYKSERSKQEGDWPMAGFSPRKQNLTLYFMRGFEDYDQLLKKLGKYTTSVSCLYIKKLADIDLHILEQMIHLGFQKMKETYPSKL